MFRADDSDSGWEAFEAAHWSRTSVLDLMILNGLISVEGVRGTRAEFRVSLDTEPQEIEGAIISTYTLRPTLTSNGYPKSVIMGASSVPAFSSITV